MKAMLSIVALALCLCVLVDAQTGSVHCGVGCACSQENKPVCGTDRLTYINECLLRCRKCDFPALERHYDGYCREVIHVGHEYALAYPHTHLSTYPWDLRYTYLPTHVEPIVPHAYARVVAI